MQFIEHLTRVQYIGIVLFFIGYFIRLWVRKNRFERRSSAGLQGFDSFSDSFIIPRLEGLARFAGNIIRFYGLYLVIIDWFNGIPMR